MAAMTLERWGRGERVVLVHGSLATGPAEWEAQRPLADEGYELVVPTRSAYVTPGAGEDFVSDGHDVADLLGHGAHLVGHSYGGLVALMAADLRPEAVRSLVLAEPPLFTAAAEQPEVALLRDRIEEAVASERDDREFLEHFLQLVGTPMDELPPGLLDELEGLVPALRRARQPWQGTVPLAPLHSGRFPAVVVTGHHDVPFHAVCVALARDHGAELRTVPGAGHEVQLAEGFNDLLRSVWQRTARPTR